MAVDRFGQPLVVRAGLVLQVFALVALAAMDSLGVQAGVVPVAIAFVVLGAGSFNYSTPQQHRLMELAPDAETTLVSLNSSAIYVGIGLSAALGALALQAAGPVANCLSGAAIAMLTIPIASPRPAANMRWRLPESESQSEKKSASCMQPI